MVKKDIQLREKLRTQRQNNALHKYFELVAEALNNAGYGVQTVLKKTMEISWSKSLVKDLLWRHAQNKLLDKRSTTMLTTKDIDRVYDELNRFLGEKFGITEPFPSLESLEENL